jgi:hypothetical protein
MVAAKAALARQQRLRCVGVVDELLDHVAFRRPGNLAPCPTDAVIGEVLRAGVLETGAAEGLRDTRLPQRRILRRRPRVREGQHDMHLVGRRIARADADRLALRDATAGRVRRGGPASPSPRGVGPRQVVDDLEARVEVRCLEQASGPGPSGA